MSEKLQTQTNILMFFLAHLVCFLFPYRVFHLRTTILPAEEEMPEIMESFKKFNDEFMSQYGDNFGYSRM